MELLLSPLTHTWVLDLDGTLLKHNGYKIDGYDTVLPGVKEFFESIPEDDVIVILTARTEEYRDITEKVLRENNLRYDHIIYNIPMGERILINDDKPSGLSMAHAIRKNRDSSFDTKISIDQNL